jgi:NAD(P)-dependent dehydrogenase (short-subunit alcohol dehydrogenase family)
VSLEVNDMNTKTNDSVVLVTGANRGLGRALVEELLARGARKVYAGARDPRQLEALVRSTERRVVPLALDVTDAASLAAAAAAAADVQILLNNAGVLASYNVLTATAEEMRHDFDVNFHGTLAATKAFLPALERAAREGGARVVNVLSIASLANVPALAAYSASKAAALSITQALRVELAKKHVRVHGVLAGAIDTDMIRAMDMPKTSAADVARGILEGLERDEDDIAPDPMSRQLVDLWRKDPKALERQLGTMG